MPYGWAAAAGALVSAGSSILGADTQRKAQHNAADIQRGMFNTIVQQEQPFLQAGYGATSQLKDMLAPGGYLTQQFDPTMEQLQNYPGYQFSLQQGGQALRNADTPGVGALSGPALKDLMSFNQNTAQTYYGNYFNQFQTQQNNIFNRLSGLATLGQNAAGNLGTSGTQLGTGIAQATAGAGASMGAGYAGAGNTIGNSIPLAYLMSGNSGGSSGNNWTTDFMGGGAGGNGFSYSDPSMSDRRLKSNIVRVSTHRLGIGIYEYDIFGERQRGVMADEVEKVMPQAVSMHPSGYKMVNYGAIG